MGEGWETARRRDDGNDWVTVQLAAQGTIRLAELDTSYFIGNSPGWASLRGCDRICGDPQREQDWFELLPRTRLQPDTQHRFVLAQARPATQVRLDIYPDGGMARLRLRGELTGEGRLQAGLRWFNALPVSTAIETLIRIGLASAEARSVVSSRPIGDVSSCPDYVRRLLAGTSPSETP
jgi:allantoicase